MTEKSLQPITSHPLSLSQLSHHIPKTIQVVPTQMKQQEHSEYDDNKNCNDQSVADPNSASSKRQWTFEEDQLVYKLHNQYGNKWAIIAQHLKGRTDNCIKNHFYSRLRKGLRKLNKLIEDQYKQNYKEFKIIDLYKVIQASDQKFKQINSYPNQMTDFGHDLKNRLFIYAQEQTDGTLQYNVKTKKLLDDMNDFTKNYKRKSKKCRRYSPMGVGSVYRNNKKQQPQTQSIQSQVLQKEKSEKQTLQKEIVKIQPVIKVEQEPEKKEKRVRTKKQAPKQNQIKTEIQIVPPKREISLPQLLQVVEQPLNRTKSRNTYRQFSDDQGQQKDEAEYLKQQRLNHFAQNILKTFKSYYSFKSFKSNSAMDELFFQ